MAQVEREEYSHLVLCSLSIAQHTFSTALSDASLNLPSEKIKKWKKNEIKNYNTLVRSVTWIKWNFYGHNAMHWLLWSLLKKKKQHTQTTHTHSQNVGLKMKPTLREPDEIRKKKNAIFWSHKANSISWVFRVARCSLCSIPQLMHEIEHRFFLFIRW